VHIKDNEKGMDCGKNGKKQKAYSILTGKLEYILHKKLRRRWKDNIKMDLIM
jgi:hypothetical protein